MRTAPRFFPAFVLLLAATAACRRQTADWYRPEPRAPRGMQGLLRDGGGRSYFQRPGRTLPFASRGRSLTVSSSLEGDGCLDLHFWSPRRCQLRLRILRRGRQASATRRFAMRPGLNAVSAGLRLRRGDAIRLAADAEGVFSRPILYRPLPAGKRQCLFLISADSLGADHLDLYGYGRRTAPAISAFRRDAVMFRWAFAASPWTLPSHMSLFTGLNELQHGVTFRVVNEEQAAAGEAPPRIRSFPLGLGKEFLIERLASRFVTCAFTGGINVAATFGFYRGFDDYHEAANDPFAADAAERLFDRAARHLLRHRYPSAFYFLHTYQVHLPYRPPGDLLAGASGAHGRRDFDFARDIGGIAGIYRRGHERRTTEAAALYDAEIMEFDRRFGGFIDSLKRAGLYERSMIILLSDHGQEFFEHGSWAHGTDLFNSQVRVPLLVKMPGGRFAGRCVEHPVSLTDLMPGVLEYFAVPLPPALRGRSLIPGLRAAPRPPPVLCTNLDCRNWSPVPPQAAWIENGFKLIRHLPHPMAGTFFADPPPSFPPWQLFRLDRDPHERRDLAAELPDVLQALRRRLERALAAGKGERPEGPQPLPATGRDALRSLGYIR